MITQMKTELARTNMIKQQLRAWNVLDQATLDVYGNTHRENFVPEEFRDIAFADTEIPIGHGQTLMPPKEEGRLLQAIRVLDRERVLLIGVQTGYLLSILAKLSLHVCAVDPYEDLRASANQNMKTLDLGNYTLIDGDVNSGWQKDAPYDVIVLTGSVPRIPQDLLNNVAVGGRLYAVVGNAPNMSATLITRESEKKWREEKLFETVRPRLPNVEETSHFEF